MAGQRLVASRLLGILSVVGERTLTLRRWYDCLIGLPRRIGVAIRRRHIVVGVWCFAALFSLLLGPAAALATDAADHPFPPGVPLWGGWSVVESVAHPEFMRFTLAHGTQRVAVELVADPSPPGAWTTGRHRLQPGPGSSADEALLRGLMPHLRRWDATRSQPVVAPIGTTDPLADEHKGESPMLRTLGSPQMVWALAWGWLVAGGLCWWRWSRRRERLAFAAAIPVLVGFGYWLLTWPIGTNWLHLLHETNDVLTAMQPEKHAGALPSTLRSLWPQHPSLWPGLARAAHSQTWVVSAAMLFFAAWASRRMPVWATGCLVVGLTASAAWWRAVLSELPSAWVAVLVWGSLAAWELWRSVEVPSRWRALAAAQLVLSVAGLWQTRAELAILAMLVLVGCHPFVESRIQCALQRCVSLARAHPVPALLVAAGLVRAGDLADTHLRGYLEWLAIGGNPLHNTGADAVMAMAGAMPPAWLVGFVAVAGLTPVAPWHRLLPGLWAAVVLFALSKIYVRSAHTSWYEAQRYLSMLMPLWAAVGAGAVGSLSGRLAGRPVLLGAMRLGLCVPGLSVLATPLFQVYPDDPWLWQPLDRDRQLEARFVHDVVALAPKCALAAKVFTLDPAGDWKARSWVVARPDKPSRLPVREDEGLLAALRTDPSGSLPPCVVELRLLDCSRVGSNLCAAPKPSQDVLLERRWVSRPYSDPLVHGAFVRDLHVQAWRVDLEALAAGARVHAR